MCTDMQANKEEVTSYLEHIRTVHFSLIIVLATLSYLVITNWNSSNELLDQLQKLTQTANNLSDDSLRGNPENLRPVLGISLDRPEGQLQRQVSVALGQSTEFKEGTNAFLYAGVQLLPGATTNRTLFQLRTDLESTTWFALTASDVTNFNAGDVAAIKTWMASRNSASGYIGFASEFSMPSNTQPNTALAEGSLRVSAILPTYGPEPVHPNKRQGFEPLRITPTDLAYEPCLTALRATFVITNISCHLPPGWFTSHFPALERSWHSVRGLSLLNAKTWARAQRVAGLKGRTLDLIGFEIKAEHIGWIGPAVVVVLLLYLGLYLSELKGLKASRPKLIPWVGAMKGDLFCVLNLMTFILLPGIVTGLVSSQMLGFGCFSACITALITAAPGIWGCVSLHSFNK